MNLHHLRLAAGALCLVGCAEATEPCTGACGAAPDLAVADVSVGFARADRTAYPLDTVTVGVRIRNNGAVASTDRDVQVALEKQGRPVTFTIPPIAPGATAGFSWRYGIPVFSWMPIGTDQLSVTLSAAHDADNANDRRMSVPFSVAPVLLALEGPSAIRYGKPATFALRISNPAPVTVPAASVSFCLWYLDGCNDAPTILPVPEIVAGANRDHLISVMMPVPILPAKQTGRSVRACVRLAVSEVPSCGESGEVTLLP